MSSATINIRTDKKVKEEAETIFKDMGLSTSSAINVFLRQTIRDKQIPFKISLNNSDREISEAIKEVDDLLKDPNRVTYSSFKELREELDV